MIPVRRFGLAGLVAAALLSTGCGGPPAPGGSGDYLENTTWTLRSIDGDGVDLGDRAPWFRVNPTEGRVEGFAGCNGFTGPYRAGGTTVTFGPLVTTRRACPDDDGNALEARVLDIMHNADGYRIDGGQLDLMIDGRSRLRFRVGG